MKSWLKTSVSFIGGFDCSLVGESDDGEVIDLFPGFSERFSCVICERFCLE